LATIVSDARAFAEVNFVAKADGVVEEELERRRNLPKSGSWPLNCWNVIHGKVGRLTKVTRSIVETHLAADNIGVLPRPGGVTNCSPSASVGIVDVDVALLGVLTSNKSDAVSQGLGGLELELDLSLGDDRRDELCHLAGFDQVRKEGIDVANWEPPHALSHGTTHNRCS